MFSHQKHQSSSSSSSSSSTSSSSSSSSLNNRSSVRVLYIASSAEWVRQQIQNPSLKCVASHYSLPSVGTHTIDRHDTRCLPVTTIVDRHDINARIWYIDVYDLYWMVRFQFHAHVVVVEVKI